ncbi:MAG: DUF899 family protein [Planctomycetota bacterium]
MPNDLNAAYQAVIKAKADLLAALRDGEPTPVEDWSLRSTDGAPVRLGELFGDRRDLLVVHNMGSGCNYCTLWADGFRGLVEHIERRAAFVLCSNDPPEGVEAFALERGWNFRCVSGADSGFAKAMGYADELGRPHPGVSAFHKRDDGTIVRTGHSPFGPGDDYCAAWPLFDLLKDGKGDFEPR